MTLKSQSTVKSDVLKSRKTIEFQSSWMAICLSFILIFVNGKCSFNVYDFRLKFQNSSKIKTLGSRTNRAWLVTCNRPHLQWTVVNRREKTIKSQKHPIINICDCFSKVSFANKCIAPKLTFSHENLNSSLNNFS